MDKLNGAFEYLCGRLYYVMRGHGRYIRIVATRDFQIAMNYRGA